MQSEPRRNVAGWILVGGQSKRMGRDKATLPAGSAAGSRTLAQLAADVVGLVARPVTLLGDPAKYGHLGFPAIGDLVLAQGPLSGIHAALTHTQSDWNLIVACDLGGLTAEYLGAMLESHPGARVVTAPGQPLCGVYHRDCLSEVEAALRENRLRVRELAARLAAVEFAMDGVRLFNINTMADLSEVTLEGAASK